MNKRKKSFALHWQILIAIILAVIYGIIFPTEFKFTDETFENFSANAPIQDFSPSLINDVETVKNKASVSEKEFFSNIENETQETLTSSQREFILKSARHNPAISYISWMGELFLRALRMIIIPLLLTSIISGIANIGSAGNLGRLGMKTVVYYLSTSTLAIITGLFFVNVFTPGKYVDATNFTQSAGQELANVKLSDTLMNIVPENIFTAFVEQNMMAIIFFSILFGFFITKIENKHRVFLANFFKSTFEVIMKITMFVIKFTPFGVFGLISKTVADQAEKLPELAESLGVFAVVVLSGLFFHILITLPLILKLIGKVNPVKHFKAMRTALLTAFSTSSSGATLSVSMEAVENNAGVSNKVTSFTLPLGATVNMDGTALYEAVVAIFIAQATAVHLDFGEQVVIVLTALLASIGAAGVPMAGLVMITIVLDAVNLPLEAIALILPVDRLLDMFRTATNVWSDSCGAVVIAKSEGESLKV